MLRITDKKLGFTLIEVLVVVVILGILLGIGYLSWSGVTNRAFNTNILNSMTTYKNALEIYAAQEHTYPSVPSTGNYCLGTSAFTAAEVNALVPSASLPTTITAQGVTDNPAYYCREINWTPQRHAGYPPLNKALASVATIPSGSDNAKKQQVDAKSGGVFVLYDADPNDFTKTRVTVKGMMKGRTCPSGTVQSWVSGSSDAPASICNLTLAKTYPVSFTGELWPYAGAPI